jgi:hypothetical protein
MPVIENHAESPFNLPNGVHAPHQITFERRNGPGRPSLTEVSEETLAKLKANPITASWFGPKGLVVAGAKGES